MSGHGFVISQEAALVQAAQRFQLASHLTEVKLLECSARAAYPGGTDKEFQLGVDLNTAVLDRQPGHVDIAVAINVAGRGDGDGPAGHIIDISCRYVLTYELAEGYDAGPDLDGFKDGNAVFHAWPYLRELVQNLTTRMAVSVPPLPMLRLQPKQDDGKKLAVKETRPAPKRKADRGGATGIKPRLS